MFSGRWFPKIHFLAWVIDEEVLLLNDTVTKEYIFIHVEIVLGMYSKFTLLYCLYDLINVEDLRLELHLAQTLLVIFDRSLSILINYVSSDRDAFELNM